MKRIYLHIILIFILSGSALAQNKFSFSQWNNNLLSVSPSYAGRNEHLSLSLLHRSQWVGVPGSPSMQNFEAHSSLKNKKTALGVTFSNEKIGASNKMDFYLNYAYRIQMDAGTIAFGIRAGLNNGKLDNLLTRQPDDPLLDPQNSAYLLPNFGAGISFYNRKYFIGVSIPTFLGTTYSENGKATIDYDPNQYMFMLSGGAEFDLSSDIKLKPMALVSYSMIESVQGTLNLDAVYKESVVAGVGYRTNDAIIFKAGYNINRQFSVLYSYDLSIGEVHTGLQSKGSHEIGLVYSFGYKVVTSNPFDF